jgi:hypothetical protein
MALFGAALRELACIFDERPALDRALSALTVAKRNGRMRECCICGDEVDRVMGVLCGLGAEGGGEGEGESGEGERGRGELKGLDVHFTCDECFNNHVQHEAHEDLRRRAEVKGNIHCPFFRSGDCTALPLSDASVARHVTVSTFEAFMRARQELTETQLQADIESKVRARVMAEQERLRALGVHQRTVEEARLHISEQLLTLKCPSPGCGQAFVDFSGCFALTCGRCGCGFCAWCLKDCGKNAHPHVRECPAGRGGGGGGSYYGTRDQFDALQRLRRQGLVEAFLGTLEGVVWIDVVRACRVSFGHLGIRIPGQEAEEIEEDGPGRRVRRNADHEAALALQVTITSSSTVKIHRPLSLFRIRALEFSMTAIILQAESLIT